MINILKLFSRKSSLKNKVESIGGSLDFLYNIRTKKEYDYQKRTEIKTDLNFNNLTLE